MRVLDLFCGAGLAADGYAAAGFEVVGVDINPQPDYPYRFLQADAFEVMQVPKSFDLIHASPPCQFLTRARTLRDAQGGQPKYPDLLTPTIRMLHAGGIPYVISTPNLLGCRSGRC